MRVLWGILILAVFCALIGAIRSLVPDTLPSFWRTFWDIVIFLAVGLPLALFFNLWAPLLYYRLQLRNRAEWASQNRYRFEQGDHSSFFLDRIRQAGIFGLTQKGIVLDALYGPEVLIVDYAYMEYSVSSDGGDDSRKGVTVFVTELNREMPEIAIWPKYKGIYASMIEKSWARFRKKYGAMIDSFFPMVEIEDKLFSDTFRIRSHDQQTVEALLMPAVKEIMLRCPKATFHIEGRYLLLHEGKILANEDLSHLAQVVLEIRQEINQ